MAVVANNRFRQRKISVKHALTIYKQSELGDAENADLQNRDLQEVETGVEKNEEKEVHLHKILRSNALKKQEYIPTPDAKKVWPEYDKFYTGTFEPPAERYVMFSATVEDCSGVRYDMDEEDEEFLQKMSVPCSEDEFEMVCYLFERIITERQPFLSIDPESVLSFEELKPSITPEALEHVRSTLARELGVKQFSTVLDPPGHGVRPLKELVESVGPAIYEHWKRRKISRQGQPIIPVLKVERSAEKDDADPYVCFRRREFRAARKTRKTDAGANEKLRKLQIQMRHARELALLVAQREQQKLKLLISEKEVFDLRCEIKPIKRVLGIQDDDEDLVSHKKRRVDPVEQQRAAAAAAAVVAANERKIKAAKSASHSSAQQSKPTQQPVRDADTPTNPVGFHAYVKLPASKVPDLELQSVEAILQQKHSSIENYVSEKMKQRQLADADFVNFTDDSSMPVFDFEIPDTDMDLSKIPYAAVSASHFSVREARYVPELQSYLENPSEHTKIFGAQGEAIVDESIAAVEKYNPFSNDNVTTIDHPYTFRRRVGRLGIQYIDRKGMIRPPEMPPLPQDDSSDAYSNEADRRRRFESRWKFDNEMGSTSVAFSEDPAKLNLISNETQIIRFGSMLVNKAYDLYRDAMYQHRQQLQMYAKKREQQLRQMQQRMAQQQSPSPSQMDSPAGSGAAQVKIKK